MKRNILILLVILLRTNISNADIAPYPIKAKGIVANEQTEVKMISEKVIVDLYKDSSHVECYFKLRNDGKAEKIQIGFPIMNFYLRRQVFEIENKQFNVYENGKKIEIVNIYKPENLKNIEQLPDTSRIKLQNFSQYENKNKPWYLWDSNFKEGETKIIKVSYSLPCGNEAKYCNAFKYLLSTGAGWKDKIDSAEVIIKLNNLTQDLILKISPTNYSILEDKIIWKFYSIKPTIKDDITLYYEKEKGEYDRLRKNTPAVLLDNKLISTDVRDDYNLNDINPLDIAMVKLVRPNETKKEFQYGAILIFTNDFTLQKFKKIIYSKQPKFNDSLKDITVSDFKSKFALKISGKLYENEKMFEKISELEKEQIKEINIYRNDGEKEEIDIELIN